MVLKQPQELRAAYVDAALRRAVFEELPEDEGFFGAIPGLPGVWGNADTLEETRTDLREAQDGWLALAVQPGAPDARDNPARG